MESMHSLLMYSLNAPTWSAYKRDKKITSEVKQQKHVNEEVKAGNFNKLLMPDFAELEACKSYIGATRQEFYLRTAPWGDQRGVRVGKAEEHMDIMAWFGDRRAGFEPIKQAMLDKYDEQIALTEFKLNDMFELSDYPDVDFIANKFQLRLSTVPLPNISDIRLLTEIPQHLRDEIEAQITSDINEGLASTLAHGMTELYKPIAHMAMTLDKHSKGEAKRLFDSVVENVRTMAEMVHKLNVMRNPVLEQLAIDAGNLVDGLTTKDLKDSEGLSAVTAKKAQVLADRIAKFIP